MLIAILAATTVAALLGGFLGLNLGGIKLRPTGPYLVHRGKLSIKFGLILGLTLGLVLGKLLGGSYDLGLGAGVISAVLGAVGAEFLCGRWFMRYMWDSPRDI